MLLAASSKKPRIFMCDRRVSTQQHLVLRLVRSIIFTEETGLEIDFDCVLLSMFWMSPSISSFDSHLSFTPRMSCSLSLQPTCRFSHEVLTFHKLIVSDAPHMIVSFRVSSISKLDIADH